MDVTRLSLLTVSTIVGITAIAALPAAVHADGLIQRIFTFREDQKERVKPPFVDKPLPPRYELGPYYDETAGQAWAWDSTTNNKVAVNYMDGSSKVLRNKPDNSYYGANRQAQPTVQPKWAYNAPRPQAQNSPYYTNPHANFRYGYGPGRVPPGYDAMQWRNYLNQVAALQQQQRLYIGEPGSAPGQPIRTNSNLGVKTQIGNPIHPFDVRPPQPIDFTSLANQRAMQQQAIVIEDGVTGRPIQLPHQQGNLAQNYIVQQGDTLSTISDQPQIYNDWLMWPLIYDANQNQLRDPDLLYPQQNLAIPRDYSPAAAAAARERARNKVPPHSFTDLR